MNPTLRALLPKLALAIGLLLHMAAVQPAWKGVQDAGNGRDFASYYYGVQVASLGENPYEKRQLSERARAEGTRRSVHPFFYPPPFLLAMQWTRALDLHAAYKLWFWIDALATLLAGLALWRMVPKESTWLIGAAVLAWASAIPNNHLMGQANLPVLAITLWGLVLSESETPAPWKPWVGGALVGLAAMLKMSPGLLVLWWLVQGRWREALAACGMALALSVLSLPILGLEHQVFFFTQVLPDFSDGGYGGLSVPIDLFGNHSIANLWAQVWPAENALSPQAKTATSATVGLLTLALLALTWRTSKGLHRWAALCALMVLMVLTPVYAYEHHVVFALPAWFVLAAALQERKLHWT
ncbi:MAG: alpha-1,2-mannosyltransferase, partial [Cognaticolwellia sp.]